MLRVLLSDVGLIEIVLKGCETRRRLFKWRPLLPDVTAIGLSEDKLALHVLYGGELDAIEYFSMESVNGERNRPRHSGCVLNTLTTQTGRKTCGLCGWEKVNA